MIPIIASKMIYARVVLDNNIDSLLNTFKEFFLNSKNKYKLETTKKTIRWTGISILINYYIRSKQERT